MSLNFDKARDLMVENQLRPNKIKEKLVIELFKTLPKENFVPEEFKAICYSDKDLNILKKRGYLKNLHLAQIIHFAEIKINDNVLHVGGLTGYLSFIISKLCKKLIIIEDDTYSLEILKNNIKNNNLDNTEVVISKLERGYSLGSPYDLIIIDCPLHNLSKDILNQLNPKKGRLIYIEKINNSLSKAYKIIKNNKTLNKEYLFDVFSNFSIDDEKSNFEF